MTTPLHVRLHHERGVPVLSVVGELDLFTAQVLRVRGQELVRKALAAPRQPAEMCAGDPIHTDGVADPAPAGGDTEVGRSAPADRTADAVVLDVTEVPFVDSAGLGAMVAVLKQVRAHHAGLSIAGASDQMHSTLQLMGLTKVVVLHLTAEEAVDAALGTSGSSPRQSGAGSGPQG